MKRYIILGLFFVLFVVSSVAQSYKPMLVDGRTWVITVDDMIENKVRHEITINVEKDTVLNGIECKKILFIGGEYGNGFYRYAFEKERQVYEIYKVGSTDFGKIICFDEDSIPSKTDIIIDSIEVKGKKYRRLRNSLNEEDSFLTFNIVEGIGKYNGLYNFLTGRDPGIVPTSVEAPLPFISHLRKVYDNGELIFEDKDFFEPAIASVKNVDLTDADIIKIEYYTISGYKTDKDKLSGGIAVKIDTYSNGKIKTSKIVVK